MSRDVVESFAYKLICVTNFVVKILGFCVSPYNVMSCDGCMACPGFELVRAWMDKKSKTRRE